MATRKNSSLVLLYVKERAENGLRDTSGNDL
jgi:hypothetical protein